MRGSINEGFSAASHSSSAGGQQATSSHQDQHHQQTKDSKISFKQLGSQAIYQKQLSSNNNPQAQTSSSLHQQSAAMMSPANNHEDEYIPLPIQTFLWRNTNPFVKPREKRESGNVIEQRDSCKLFERIIITNNVWGQSPSLTDAIASIDRWRLIKVSFPFVLQSTANQLNNKFIRDYTLNKMGSNESKMLYCLQWILMNAAEECADSENEAKSSALASLGASGAILKPLGAMCPGATSSNSGSASISPAGAVTGTNLAAGCLTGAAAVAAGIAVGQALASQASTSSTSTNLDNHHQTEQAQATKATSKRVSTTSTHGFQANQQTASISGPLTVISALNQSILKMPATSAAVAIAMPTTVTQQAAIASTSGPSLRVEHDPAGKSPVNLATSSSGVSPIGQASKVANQPATPAASQQHHQASTSPQNNIAAGLLSTSTSQMMINNNNVNYNYLLPISSIQMFVHYFAPLMEPLEMSDFLKSNQRLEIGVAMWQPLFNYQLPNVQCLNAPVKLQHQQLIQQQQQQQQQSSSASNQRQHVQQQTSHKRQDTFFTPQASLMGKPTTTTVDFQDIPLTKSVSSVIDSRRRSSAAVTSSSTHPPGEHHQIHLNSHQQSQFGDVFIGGPNNSSGPTPTPASTKSQAEQQAESAQQDNKPAAGLSGQSYTPSVFETSTTDFDANHLRSSTLDGDGVNANQVNYATYLDVAVLRCLFTNNWQEAGVFWALRYTSNRLDQFDYSDANVSLESFKARSKSLPNLNAACLQYLQTMRTSNEEQLMAFRNQNNKNSADFTTTATNNTEDFMLDYLKITANSGELNDMSVHDRNMMISSQGGLLSSANIKKQSQASNKASNKNKCANNEHDQQQSKLARPLQHPDLLHHHHSYTQHHYHHHPSRRSSSAEDLTSKQLADLASGAKTSSKRHLTKRTTTRELIVNDLDLEAPEHHPLITIGPQKAALNQDHKQLGSKSTLINLDNNKTNQEEQDRDTNSMAKAEQQFLIQSLYLKSLRRLDRITRSFSVPKDMNYSSTWLGAQSGVSSGHQRTNKRQSMTEESPESIASGNYIDSKGRIDPIIVLKLIHSITQRELVCSLRVCDELLTLVYKLIQIGIMNDNFHFNMAQQEGKHDQSDLANLLPTRQQDYTMLTDLDKQREHIALISTSFGGRRLTKQRIKLNQQQQMFRRHLEEASQKSAQVLKMLIDITLYMYHHSGCPNRCGLDSIMDQLQHAVQNHKIKFISATVKQPSQAASSQNIIAEDQLLERLFKPKLRQMLVTLYKHDEEYFTKYVKLIIQSRTLQEIVDILHSILGFCRSDYIVNLTQLTSQQPAEQKHQQQQAKSQTTEQPQTHQPSTVQFCNVLDSPQSHGNDSMARISASAAAAAAAATSPSGASSGPLVEAEILNSVFKLLVTRMADVDKKLKLQEHTSLYCDIRRLIAFVRDNYNGTFRRILLSSLIDCTKIMNEQQREDERQQNILQQQHQFANDSNLAWRANKQADYVPSDDELIHEPTTTRAHLKHHQQQQLAEYQGQSTGSQQQHLIGRASPTVTSNYSDQQQQQSPINVGSSSIAAAAVGGPPAAASPSSPYLINDQLSALHQPHRASHGSDRPNGNTTNMPPYHKSSSSQQFQQQQHQLDQQQHQSSSGILSLSKAKKKLEQVFGGKTGGSGGPGGSPSMASSSTRALKASSMMSSSNTNMAASEHALSSTCLLTATTSSSNANQATGGVAGSFAIDAMSGVDDPSRRTSIIGNQSVGSIHHHDSITTTATLNARSSQINISAGHNNTISLTVGGAAVDPITGVVNPNLPIVPGPYSLLGSLQAGGNLMSRRLFEAMHNGMTNFSFLMESSPPGEFLDPALLAALLDLESPIAIRAAIFLECSNLVHRCNRGQWPSWMKMNMAPAHQHHHQTHLSAMHRPSSVGLGGAQLAQAPGSMAGLAGSAGLLSSASKFRKSSSIQRNVRNNTLMYRAAGKAFYSWAEAIGVRLEEMLLDELDRNQVFQTSTANDQAGGDSQAADDNQATLSSTTSDNTITTTVNNNKQTTSSPKATQEPTPRNSSSSASAGGQSDIDFFQSTIGNSTSPFALKMAACQLLFEVTTFLRETYRYLPPSIASHQVVGSKLGDKMTSIYDVSRAVTANRRWSMALSSLGFGQLPATLSALSTSPGAPAGPTSQGQMSSSSHLKTSQAPSSTTSIPEHPSERRISFILHESNNENDTNGNSVSGNENSNNSADQQQQFDSSQSQAPLATVVTTNDQQQEAIRKMTGRNLSQTGASNAVVIAAATCLLRSSGMIDAQPHRRKSIKLKKREDRDTTGPISSASASAIATTASSSAKKVTKFAPTEQHLTMDEDEASGSGGDACLRRTDSLRSRRRVSGISEKSDASEQAKMLADHHQHHQPLSDNAQQQGGPTGGSSGQQQQLDNNLSGDDANSLGNNSCDDGYGHESADRFEQDQTRIMSNMPWFKAISLINSNIDCECIHFPNCRPQCYKLHQNMCKRLILSVQTIYSSGNGDDEANLTSIFEAKLAALVGQHATTAPSDPQQPHGLIVRAGSDCSGNTLNEEQSSSRANVLQTTGTPKSHGYKQQKQAAKQAAAAAAAAAAVASGSVEVAHSRQQLDPNHASLLETLRALNLYKSNQSTASKKQQHQQVDELSILRYLRISVRNFLHCPMSAFLKGAVILPRESFVEMIRFSWNLLLEDDQQLSRTAAVCFIISSIKCAAEATELLMNELASTDASKKIAAINKFHVVWDARYQCWPRLEDGAFVHFKMAPPSIEFTLPSPKIAQESKPVVDPPWMPRKTSNVEEVTIGQDQTVQRSFVTATKTRRKQQIEIVNRALREKHDKLRQGRESYHITSVPVTLYAAYEPTLGVGGQPGSDDPDGVGGSGGGGGGGANSGAGLDDDSTTQQQESRALIQMKTAQALFPTCLCQAAIVLINLLDDSRVTYEGSAVYEVASKVIWSCLVEDPSLFLRYFFERLTRQNQSTIFQVLRRLIRFMPKLPPQAAFTLYNYLIGFVIYYIRSPVAISQKLIAETLSVLSFVVPSVYALFLKDLKQIFRKEQCDNSLLITANVPSAKKIIVHGSDSSGIPSQFPIDESTQFYHILIDSLEFFGVKKDKQNEYFLIDVRTQQMHNLHSYVRDHYSFKRSQHPQLQLISMNPDKAFHILQSQELTNQFLEFGKVLMTHTVVKSSHMAVGRALFLHEELMKLPTFPRRALETNFSLFRGTTGHQVFSMDRMHKVCWVKAISRMFELTSGFFLQLGEIHLFLNAISGVFVLHCEEAGVSRLCLATFINAAHHFKNIFATDGFTPIMSTIVQVYSNHQNNHLLCRSIEFVCKQFYIMHRKPFLLQLFGSVASRLNTAEILQQNQTSSPISANTFYTTLSSGNHLSGRGAHQQSGGSSGDLMSDPSCISPNAFFRLLQSLEKAFKDPLDILELVEAEKPLRAVDFCYQQDKEVIDILDIISLCVTVTAYASDSPRSTQMLIILETVVPLYMKHLQAATSKKAGQSMGKQAHKDELQKIQSISVCIRTLIVNCDGLTRSFSGPLPYIDFKSSSIRRNGALSNKSSNANQQMAAAAASSSSRSRQNQQGNLSSPAPDMFTTNTEFSHSGVQHNLLRPHAGSSSAGGITKQAKIAPQSGGGGTGAGASNYNKTSRQAMNSEESEITRGEFIVPRDTLLNLTAEFLSLSTVRLVESAKKYVDLHQKHSSYELLDVKSHLKLAEVANSLLKFASTDPSVMACRGLTRYMNEILPNTEWRQEAIRPALIMILKRLDKTFNRIAKKNSVKRNTDWEGAKQLLKGAYLTFIKHPYIVHLPHLKSLISCCQNIILSDSLTGGGYSHLLSANFFQGLASSSSQLQQQQANQLVSSPATAPVLSGRGQLAGSISQSASMQMGGSAGHSLQQQASINSSNNNLLRVSNQHHASGSSLAPSNSSNQLNHHSSHSPIDGASNNNNNNSTSSGKMANLPSFVTTVAAATLAERLAASTVSGNYSVTSQAFNSVTVRLIAMQLLQAGESQTLESLVGNSMNTAEKLESVTLNLIYPMCIRVCSGSREAPKLRPCDITFILNVVLNMLAPHSSSSKSCASSANSPKVTSDTSQFILSKISTTIGTSSAQASGAIGGALGIVAGGGGGGGGVSSTIAGFNLGGASSHQNRDHHHHHLSNSNSAGGGSAAATASMMQQQQQLVQHQERLKIAFLGLKILCVCFESHLAGEWIRISRVIRDLTLERNQPIGSLWDFIDFVATYRFPLLVLLIPTIKCDLARKIRQQQMRGAAAGKKCSPSVSGSASGSLGAMQAVDQQHLQVQPKAANLCASPQADDESEADARLARYNLQCLKLIEAKICGQAVSVCRSRSFLFVSLAAELRMLKEQLVAKRRAQLEGDRNTTSATAGSHHHQHSASPGGAGAGAPLGAGSSASAGLGTNTGHRSSGGGGLGLQASARQEQLGASFGGAGGSQPDHFSTYHRLSAAIASFANQAANQAGKANHGQQSGASSGGSTGPVMTSAALKASTCFAAQLAAPGALNTQQQQDQQQQTLVGSPDESMSQQKQSQNSIRLSSAKSREEARAVMNTILRRTSYPRHLPMGSPEHQTSSRASTTTKQQSSCNDPAAMSTSRVDVEAGCSGSTASNPTGSSSVQLSAASLMSAIPAPRPKSSDNKGQSVLKQLVSTIDKRNKEQQEQKQ